MNSGQNLSRVKMPPMTEMFPASSKELSCPPAVSQFALTPEIMQMQLMQQMQIQMLQAQTALAAATPAHTVIGNIGAQLGMAHLQIKQSRDAKDGQSYKDSFKFRAWGEE